MQKDEYREIDEDTLQEIYGKAWSIENMEAHGAGNRSVTYIGSVLRGDIITDYYADTQRCYWFGNRALKGGEIVSMDVYIFGHELKRYKRKS